MTALQARLSDDDLVRISSRLALDGWQLEYVRGKVIVSPPTGGETGNRTFNLYGALAAFASARDSLGFDSSTGFRLDDGDVLSPDAALVSAARMAALSDRERKQFPLVAKCTGWHEAGSHYVVLLDPKHRSVRTWGVRPDGFPELTAS